MTEILAPCGSPEVLTAALRAGCDAVYLGGSSFSARQNAVNFSDKELAKAVYECHKRGVKVYRTINTVIFDSQLEECKKAVEYCAKIGIDGLITQDLALVEIVKKCCPDMEIHASTQMTVHTADGVEMTKRLGFSRAVLARELPLDIIRELSDLGTETEVFVHGAECMSVSGQCYMSAVIGSRSANRGLCAQACRLPCSAVKGADRYDLSLKDMSYLDSIQKLADAGVTSFKIEGRMKRPEYVALSVKSLKQALAGEKYDRSALSDVFSRGGFTDGYLYGKTGREMFGIRQKEDVKASAKILPEIHEIYRREEKRAEIKFSVKIRSNQPLTITAQDNAGCSVTAAGDIPAKAKSKACSAQTVEKQLSKLGDTIYSFGGLECDMDGGLFVSPSVLNDLRRTLCEELNKKRAEKNSAAVDFKNADILSFECPEKRLSQPKIRVKVSYPQQLEQLDFDKIDLCGVPLSFAAKAAEKYPAYKLMAVMPRFTFDEQKQNKQLDIIKAAGITKLLAENIAHVKCAQEKGFELHTDFGFNITNSAALNAVKKLGAADAVVSFELKAGQISALKKPLPIGVTAYGRLPLMLTVNCPIKQAAGCKNCTGKVTDRTGRDFPVKCSKHCGYTEILNSEVLYLADKLDEFRGIDFITLEFYDESPEEVNDTVSRYLNKSKSGKSVITRGLYFRGVL